MPLEGGGVLESCALSASARALWISASRFASRNSPRACKGM